jgi:hypothetical protein
MLASARIVGPQADFGAIEVELAGDFTGRAQRPGEILGRRAICRCRAAKTGSPSRKRRSGPDPTLSSPKSPTVMSYASFQRFDFRFVVRAVVDRFFGA